MNIVDIALKRHFILRHELVILVLLFPVKFPIKVKKKKKEQHLISPTCTLKMYFVNKILVYSVTHLISFCLIIPIQGIFLSITLVYKLYKKTI